tara:strand:- start:19 stop:1428 length:1410 start_codon:yes stop_codon:yes gene_type:complete
MSTIKVNKLEQRSGCTATVGGGAGKTVVVDATTVTLGRCGGAVNLASGATQTGFGRTGTVDWNTTPKTSTFTAVSGDGFFANTSGGAFTMNLPSGSAGSIVSVADYAGTWQTNALTVAPNGSDKIGSVNTSVILNIQGQSVTLVFVDSTQGWINTMDSTSNVRGNAFLCASVSGSGNSLVTAPCCANAKIATFTGPGTFTVNGAAACTANNTVSYMVVAGGGGGATSSPNSNGGGGGGAGGFREVKSPVTPYTSSPLQGYSVPANRVVVSAQGYPITVGAGGTACSPSAPLTSGANSVFASITSAGGGNAGSRGPKQPFKNAGNGGSGGGGAGGVGSAGSTGDGGSGNTPPVSPSQGNNGGPNYAVTNGSPPDNPGGGGGGAGATGGISASTGGNGGAGVATTISSSPVTRAGGGAGGGSPPGSAGPGGGAANGGSGSANTGGGAGGVMADANGGAGGSGIVIIRYKFQ